MNDLKLITTQDYLLLVDIVADSPKVGDKACLYKYNLIGTIKSISEPVRLSTISKDHWWTEWKMENVSNGQTELSWNKNLANLIIAHRPLQDDVPVLEGMLLLEEWKQKDNAEQLTGYEIYDRYILPSTPEEETPEEFFKRVFMLGYNSRRWTDADMRNCWNAAIRRREMRIDNADDFMKSYLQSLSPAPVGFEPEYEACCEQQCDGTCEKIINGQQNTVTFKTYTATFRDQEREFLCGKYIY